MTRSLRRIVMVGALLGVIFGSAAALAQKQGGILRVHALDSPPSLSMHEEADAVPARATMGLVNNLVMFDQHARQNDMQSIVPDLATGWSWSEDGTELTFPLREGVKWHDGKPFTAADVKCTWDLLTGKSSQRLRLNPRKSWYHNLEKVTTNGDFEVTFHLHRPQPAFVALLASGRSVVYPCHVPPAEMRQHPIGTGPFKFVEFKPNERITVTRNPDYWKNGRPYLDGIEFTIILDASTAPRLCRRQARLDGDVDAAAEGRQEPGARGDLRGDAGRHQPEPDHQPRRATFRQRGYATGNGAELGPQSVYRHHKRRLGRHRRGHATFA